MLKLLHHLLQLPLQVLLPLHLLQLLHKLLKQLRS
jgi:hypothetical protein